MFTGEATLSRSFQPSSPWSTAAATEISSSRGAGRQWGADRLVAWALGPTTDHTLYFLCQLFLSPFLSDPVWGWGVTPFEG